MFKKGDAIVFKDVNESALSEFSTRTGIPIEVVDRMAGHPPIIVYDVAVDPKRIYIVDPDEDIWWAWSRFFRLHCVWGET